MTATAVRPELHLGLDLGSSETKVVAYDADGRALAELTTPTRWQQLPGQRTQTTGAALVDGALTVLHGVVAALRDDVGEHRVRSLGVTGLGESGVLLGPDGDELAPVVAWFDLRGAEQVDRLDASLAGAFPARTGLRLDAQASLAKLLWFRDQGLVAPPGSCWLNAPEHLVHALGGERVAEPSLASRTGLLDQDSAAPWPEALAAAHLPDGALPPLRAAGAPAGTATHPGLPPEVYGAVLTVAGHDHPVACVGAGATGPDELFNGAGTADTLVRSVPGRLTDATRTRLVAAGFSAGMHVLPDTSVLIGNTLAGLVLRRVLAALGAQDPPALDALDALAAARPGSAPGVSVRGGRAGEDAVTVVLHDGASPAAVLATTLHHLGEETAALLDTLGAVVGPHCRASASGGWVRLRSVLEAKQRVVPHLTASPVTRSGCRGAALLGALAAQERAAGAEGAADGLVDGLSALVRHWDAHDPTGTPRRQRQHDPGSSHPVPPTRRAT